MDVREALRSMWQRSLGSVSLVIVGVCVTLFLGVSALDLLGIVSRRDVAAVLGLSSPGLVQRRFLFELVTAPLLHANLTHLLFNMLSLWMLGPEVELRLGRARYLLFSAVCAVSGMAGFLAVNWHTGQVVMGYSGVIFGIVVAQAIYFPNSVVAMFAFFPLKMQYAAWLLGAVELYLTVSPEGTGVAHAAHLFGAVAALAFLRINGWVTLRPVRARVAPAPATLPRRWRGRGRADIPTEL